MKTLNSLMMALVLAMSPTAAMAQGAPAQDVAAGRVPLPAAKPAAAGTMAASPAPATTADAAALPPGGGATVSGATPTASAPASGAATAPGAGPAAAATAGATPAGAKPVFQHMLPTADIGQPIPGGWGIQPQVNEVGEDAKWFHNAILMPIITVISLFVLALLLWVVVRYRRAANPVPSRTSHNTAIEIIWTLAPVLILLAIAVPSIRLLAKQYAPPAADLTVKVIGNQWYWTYQYPDNGDFEIVSNMLKEKDDPTRAKDAAARTDADGPKLLAVDERMVVPAGAVVKLIVTSNDVIHSFAMPAFWDKMDAVPGRLNETWFKVNRPGVYFGQCSELCGARHGFMPIVVEVVPPARYAEWVATKGGTMPGAKGAANPDATATSPATGATAPAPAGATASDTPVTATAKPATTSQAATANEGSAK